MRPSYMCHGARTYDLGPLPTPGELVFFVEGLSVRRGCVAHVSIKLSGDGDEVERARVFIQTFDDEGHLWGRFVDPRHCFDTAEQACDAAFGGRLL